MLSYLSLFVEWKSCNWDETWIVCRPLWFTRRTICHECKTTNIIFFLLCITLNNMHQHNLSIIDSLEKCLEEQHLSSVKSLDRLFALAVSDGDCVSETSSHVLLLSSLVPVWCVYLWVCLDLGVASSISGYWKNGLCSKIRRLLLVCHALCLFWNSASCISAEGTLQQ